MTQRSGLRRRIIGIAGAALLSAILPAVSAHAQTVDPSQAPPGPAMLPPDAERIVTLRDGSMYRGFILELVPQDHLTLRLASGEQRRIPWTDIQSQSLAAPVPVPPAPFLAPSSGPPPQLGSPLAPGVLVHIDSPNPQARLYRQLDSSQFVGMANGGFVSGSIERWQPICGVPCDVPVDPTAYYQIRGPGMTYSRGFELPYGRPQVALRVEPGSLGRRVGGFVAIVLGTTAIATAAGLFTVYAVLTPDLTGQNPTTLRSNGMLIGGGVTLGLGVAALATGIALMATSATRVWVDKETRLAGIRLRSSQGPLLTSQGLLF